MKKNILTLAVLLAVSVSTADVLLWQVTTEEATKYTSTSGSYADYAVFYYADASGVKNSWGTANLFDGDYAYTTPPEDFAMEEKPIYVTDPDLSLAGKSFWIELYDTQGHTLSVEKAEQVAWSWPISYDVLSDYLTADLTMLSPIYHPHVTPEPTGGILFLLGAGLLALRRRR